MASSDDTRRRIRVFFGFLRDICVVTGENRCLEPCSMGCVCSQAFPTAEVAGWWLEPAGCPTWSIEGPLVGK